MTSTSDQLQPDRDPPAEQGQSDDLFDKEIEVLYEKEAARLRGYLRRISAVSSHVDDIVHDAFLATRQQWSTVRHYERPEAYLYKVARHRSFRLAAEGRRVELMPSVEAAGGPTEDIDARLDVERALGKLSPRQREVVLLFYYLRFKEQEIAVILQIAVGTVKSLLNQARKRLAVLLRSGEEPS
jgi:RNA polymerase sigma factor (sigma-70 family)